MQNVTRHVIEDVWPLYSSGEASADTRALVEAFLQQDPEFAQMLRESATDSFSSPEPPALSPDHELRTLVRIRKRLTGPIMFLQLALAFTCFSFGALISDTSFDVSPRRFIVTATIAVGFWITFLVKQFRGRREVLLQVRR